MALGTQIQNIGSVGKLLSINYFRCYLILDLRDVFCCSFFFLVDVFGLFVCLIVVVFQFPFLFCVSSCNFSR